MFTPHQVSHVRCHVSGVISQVSGVRCQLSCVRCHVSRVRYIYIYFFCTKWCGQLWRVCYQRGLPRLVYRNKLIQIFIIIHIALHFFSPVLKLIQGITISVTYQGVQLPVYYKALTVFQIFLAFHPWGNFASLTALAICPNK